MKTLPDKLIPENKQKFDEYRFNRELCKLRQKIVDYMYSGDTRGFDLKTLHENDSLYTYSHIDIKLVKQICKELNEKGWKTKIAFGNTTLFIYEREEELPPFSNIETLDD